MPLIRSFELSKKRGREAWIEPLVDHAARTLTFCVHNSGAPAIQGTTSRRGAYCLICGEFSDYDYVREYSRTNGLGQRLVAMVTEDNKVRIYRPPSDRHQTIAESAAQEPHYRPEGEIADNPGHTNVYRYGLTTWGSLFTSRQLVALTTFCDLVREARVLALEHSGYDEDYANGIATYLSLAVMRLLDFFNTEVTWDGGNGNFRQLTTRQALPMTWDFAEGNPLHGPVDFGVAVDWVARGMARLPSMPPAFVVQLDTATTLPPVARPLIVTDPPYYDNIPYADLTDFFYVWLRRSLSEVYPGLFSTLLTPKQPELVASAYRFGGNRKRAEEHFESGMKRAFILMRDHSNTDYPLSLYYAFKQQEAEVQQSSIGTVRASTGWETMLQGLMEAGFQITATWPMRTEQKQRAIAAGANALASSIVLCCRPRPSDAPIATRRELLSTLRRELPEELKVLMSGRVAPVDLAQAAIGPGMTIFSRYSRVLEADGSSMTVRTALQEINYVIEDVLAEQEGDLDVESQFCVNWFQQHGSREGPYGEAEVLARAKNVAIDTLARLGQVEAGRGKVRLLLHEDYEDGWDPRGVDRLTAWEACQRLVWTLQQQGEVKTGVLARRLGGMADQARELAFRLYGIADQKGWAEEALGYNALVASWPGIQKHAAAAAQETQGRMAVE